MIKRFTAIFLTQLCLITVIGLALNLNFCNDAHASVSACTAGVPPGIKEPPVALKKAVEKQQPEVKVKDASSSESTSVISKLFSFEMPKTTFGDFVLSAQKALFEKLTSDAPAAASPPPCGKTSQYIRNGVLQCN